MTLAERFGDWLAAAMRQADMDIDRQKGGGRVALANKLDVSRSTVSRWLDGQALPSPEYFQPIADAVGVPVLDMLVATGIIAPGGPKPAPTDRRIITQKDMEEIADELGVLPSDRGMFSVFVNELLNRSRHAREQ